MSVILVTGILLIAISVLTEKKYKPYVGFAFVFLIMGFQSGVEGDFLNYKEKFEALALIGVEDFTDGSFEPGWFIIRKMFCFTPFWFFVMCLSLFQCVVLERLTKKYCARDYQFLSAVLFFFTFQLMLWQMKALRQGLAVETMVLAFLLADSKKNIWPSLICAFVAFTIHNSALIMAPFVALFYFSCRRKDEINHKKRGILTHDGFPVLMVVLYFALYSIKELFLSQYLAPLAFTFIDETGSHIAGYLDEANTKEGVFSLLGESTSPLLVAYNGIMVFLLSWFVRFADHKMRVLVAISIISVFADMLFYGLGSLPRLFMYFTVFNIVVFPSLCKTINVKYGKIVTVVLIVLLIGYAWKTSVPWMLEAEDGRFGTYHFVFW